ncbi:MAG TPA: alpha/beta hydrolase [Cyclobacteriaceae bacterium]
MNTKRIIKISFPFILLAGIYFLGPEPEKPAYSAVMPIVPSSPADLEKFIDSKEKLHKLKPDNEARIVWKDSTKSKTEYVVVYLHGFSASQKEGDPVHLRFAKEFGCNLYLARLADHGVDTTEQLLLYTADRAWESAKQALAIGKQLGNKIILMSTSTGGTLALMLAAQYPDDVYALISMSPNIAINNPAAFILNNPWGLQIARMVFDSKYSDTGASEEKSKYWNNKYRLESITQLEQLLEDNMNKNTFSEIKQPSLILYYYKNEQEQDPEVKVSAMLEMNKMLATPDSLKEEVAIPTAGAHILGSPIACKDVEAVYSEIEKFAIQKLKLVKQ